MTRTTLALSLALLLVPALAGAAAPPQAINFQGRLADAAGTPRTGSYSMKFSIHNASTGGTQCFLEQQVVAANSGLFNVNIGSQTPIGCTFTEAYWIQIDITIDGTTWETMSPRLALTAAAYAFRAYSAANSDKLSGNPMGASSGNIPQNSGTLMTNLNADMLDGMHVTDILGSVNKPVYSCNQTLTCNTQTCTASTIQTPPPVNTVCVSLATRCANPTVPTCPSGWTEVSSGSIASGCSDGEGNPTPLYYRSCQQPSPQIVGYLRAP